MSSGEVSDSLLAGQRVLVVWHRAHTAEVIQPVLEGLRERAGRGGGQVVIEHAERLTLGEWAWTPAAVPVVWHAVDVQLAAVVCLLYSFRPPISLVFFSAAGYPESSFDTVLSGVLPPSLLSHPLDLLAEMARIMKPSGTIVIWEPVATEGWHMTGGVGHLAGYLYIT